MKMHYFLKTFVYTKKQLADNLMTGSIGWRFLKTILSHWVLEHDSRNI